MTQREPTRNRAPGTLGLAPGTYGGAGRVPGPLGFAPNVFPAPGSVLAGAASTKKTKMPAHVDDHHSRDLHAMAWPLFDAKSNQPAFDQVAQADSILNCPVPATLAALASVDKGRDLLKALITEVTGRTTTEISPEIKKSLNNKPKGSTITSKRYFTVKLPKGSVDVSDVLFTDDSDRGWSPLYMRDPGGKSLWASLVEKAIAVRIGGYDEFNSANTTANAYWKMITGTEPEGFAVDGTPPSRIVTAARAATRVPTLAASKDITPRNSGVTGFHGYTMLGMKGSKIELYDPFAATTLTLSTKAFRDSFTAILWQRL